MSGLVSTHDLRPSERAFVTAMQRLCFGRFESLEIRKRPRITVAGQQRRPDPFEFELRD